MYHNVSNITCDINGINVSPENFFQQMRFIKEHYEVKKLDSNINDGVEPAVVITFDDGYQDLYHYAWPILEELQIPATIFVTTGCMETNKELWPNELIRLILTGSIYPEYFHYNDKVFDYTFATGSYPERMEAYRILRHLFIKLNAEERSIQLSNLRKWAGMSKDGRTQYLTLNKSQCLEMSKSSLITIGAHTITHPSLKNLSDKEIQNELTLSKKFLENIIHKEVHLFAYPFGGRFDYDDRIIERVKRAGYSKAVTTHAGLVDSTSSDFELPRIVVRDWDIKNFQNKLMYLLNDQPVPPKVSSSTLEYIGRFHEDPAIFKAENDIVIFGTGKKGMYFLEILETFGLKHRIKGFCDNNIQKQGTTINGITVFAPDNLKTNLKDAIVILASTYDREILSQLNKMHVKHVHFYV